MQIYRRLYERKAVRLTETSGRTIARLAGDLGIGVSRLSRWKRICRWTDLLAHVRMQFRLFNEIYSAPRMHVELHQEGLPASWHRIAC